MRTRTLELVLVLSTLIGACGEAPRPGEADTGSMDDAGSSTGMDGATDASVMACETDGECDDATFCNGSERCMPGATDADARGCVDATAGPCSAGEVCDEAAGTCDAACVDADADGHGAVSCGGDDCDDADRNRHPGNVEVCDMAAHDEDCNTETFGFLDADSDGSGSRVCCNVVATGDLACADDCNDGDSTVNPRAGDGPPLFCDGVDNDCSGTADEGCPCVEGETQACGTAPQLGSVGICRPGTQVCSGGAFTAMCIGAVPPNEEVCDALDNDCDGTVDEAVLRTYYPDVDGDGYGTTAGTPATACSAPVGYASNDDDCDDVVRSVNPGATEVCNGIDDNCLAGVDEGFVATFYRDADRDGFGDTAMTAMACTPPAGYVRSPDDCDDAAAARNPATFERCNGVDDDCDGTADEGCTCTDGSTRACGSSSTGACRTGTQQCLTGVWASCVGQIEPTTELCNGLDEDCDGTPDDGVTVDCYADGDSDAFGSGPRVRRCPDPTRAAFGMCPPGFSDVATDCNDASPSVRPFVAEVCNGIDDDCDGTPDEAVRGTFYRDADGDGFGALATTTTACAAPAGYVNSSTDCNDARTDVSPVATERCDAAMVDEDCDGSQNEMCACADGATMACGASATSPCRRGTQQCIAGAWTACSGQIDPATELCNGVDDDCDGTVDDGFLCRLGATRAGTGTFGACASVAGVYTCSATCTAEAFSPLPPAESCNGADDDCDGTIDDGFTCARSSTGHACTTSCGTVGTRACNASCTGYATCTAALESCNGCDDDGDALADDGLACVQGTTRTGCTNACGATIATNTERCRGDCSGYETCRSTDEGPTVGMATCNGCDDDLDGVADDGFACVAGRSYDCTTACGTSGRRTCSATCTLPTCNAAGESCNYCDDDGDGTFQDDAALATDSSQPTLRCSDAWRFSGTATCTTESIPGLTSHYVNLGATTGFTGSAAWRVAPLRMGWGAFTVRLAVQMRRQVGARPGEGFAIVLSRGGSGDLGGAAEVGVPLARRGLSFEWRFWTNDFNIDEPDRLFVRRLDGTGIARPFLTAGATGIVDGNVSGLDWGSSDTWSSPVSRTIDITYVPDDPRTPADEETLRVQVDGATEYYWGGTLDTILANEFVPGDTIEVGVVSSTGGYLHAVRVFTEQFVSATGTWAAPNSYCRLANVCF